MSRITSSAKFASKKRYISKMTSFTLYGARGSTCTDRVRLTLAEGGFTDYELVFLDLQKGMQRVSDPFLLEDRAASSCDCGLRQASNLCSLVNICFSCVQRSILIANAVLPSPKNI